MGLLDDFQNGIYDRLLAGPWPVVDYSQGRRTTTKQEIRPQSLLVRPISSVYDLVSECGPDTRRTGMQFEAILAFPHLISTEEVERAWALEALRAVEEDRPFVVYLRSLRYGEGAEVSGQQQLALVFQAVRV
jgi:hypothetical protein